MGRPDCVATADRRQASWDPKSSAVSGWTRQRQMDDPQRRWILARAETRECVGVKLARSYTIEETLIGAVGYFSPCAISAKDSGADQ
jgi:transposase